MGVSQPRARQNLFPATRRHSVNPTEDKNETRRSPASLHPPRQNRIISITMSKINIDGIVKDIRTRTTYITPLVEAVCNSIDAIGAKADGQIDIVIKREEPLPEIDSNALGDIIAIDVIDNGIGFTEANRESFDTYRSDMKISQGGKGFGRFMYLKYFNDVRIESTFIADGKLNYRNFTFGRRNNIIENEQTGIIEDDVATGTILHLSGAKKGIIQDKGIDVIARKLLEKLLVFFVDKEHPAPIIRIFEVDKSNSITLNNYIGEDKAIVFVGSKPLNITNKHTGEILDFNVQVYKIYYSQAVSRVSLTANKREVTDTALHTYIPEFKETLFAIDNNGRQRNYSVKAYVLGSFLDENVTVERDGFAIGKDEDDLFSCVTENEIEKDAASVVKEYFYDEMTRRFEEKRIKVESYVSTKAPWHRTLMRDLDLESMPMRISDQELEMRFQKAKFEKEQRIQLELKEIEARQDEEPNEDFNSQVSALVGTISTTSKNDLVHYVCTRKKVIDLFDLLRKRKDDGSSSLERDIHNIIYPMGRNSTNTEYEDHNLWLLDERLVFSTFTASDQSNFRNDNDAPDLAVFFDNKKMYRQGDNTAISPVCIVEFKRPKRTSYSAGDNPITQACHYARKILDGEYEMPDGIEPIKVDKNSTPVYVYVVCDIVSKIKEFAADTSLVLSPDGERYFGYMKNYNAYVEVMSYRSLIETAKMRNAIFFKKLGL